LFKPYTIHRGNKTMSQETPNEQEAPVTPPVETPTPPVATPPIDFQAVAVQQQRVIAEQAENYRKMEAKLAAIDARLSAPAPVDPKVASEQFFADPLSMINRAIQEQLKPLNDSRAEMERRHKYETLKNQMKRDPRFQALTHAAVESALDSLVQEHTEFNANLIVKDYYTAIGTVAANGGFAAEPTPVQPPAPKEPVVTTPPHMRPSAPPPRAAAPNDKPKVRELTENERHLARLYGMTPEQYIAGLGEGESVTAQLEVPTFTPKS
jgi:hypothetical protein